MILAVAAEDPEARILDVYDTKDGLWNPDQGELEMPADWEYLPSGDAFVTRQVKAAGVYWTIWKPRGRNRPHRRKLGLLAPTSAITAAQLAAEETAERRGKQRVASAGQRQRAEEEYRRELSDAVVAWLDFAPEHQGLARRIGQLAAERAAVVGSGRVGRTRTLTIDERAELAGRACIRHGFTDYEDQLAEIDPLIGDIDDFEYRDIRRDAHAAVDQFLAAHRTDPGATPEDA